MCVRERLEVPHYAYKRKIRGTTLCMQEDNKGCHTVGIMMIRGYNVCAMTMRGTILYMQ
jgi:hypothetical protein